jgi:hypothetical protein
MRWRGTSYMSIRLPNNKLLIPASNRGSIRPLSASLWRLIVSYTTADGGRTPLSLIHKFVWLRIFGMRTSARRGRPLTRAIRVLSTLHRRVPWSKHE